MDSPHVLSIHWLMDIRIASTFWWLFLISLSPSTNGPDFWQLSLFLPRIQKHNGIFAIFLFGLYFFFLLPSFCLMSIFLLPFPVASPFLLPHYLLVSIQHDSLVRALSNKREHLGISLGLSLLLTRPSLSHSYSFRRDQLEHNFILLAESFS